MSALARRAVLCALAENVTERKPNQVVIRVSERTDENARRGHASALAPQFNCVAQLKRYFGEVAALVETGAFVPSAGPILGVAAFDEIVSGNADVPVKVPGVLEGGGVAAGGNVAGALCGVFPKFSWNALLCRL
jgi:hypothetical protein